MEVWILTIKTLTFIYFCAKFKGREFIVNYFNLNILIGDGIKQRRGFDA